MILEFSWQIFKITHIWNFMKICTVEAEFFYAEGQTDRRI